MAKGIFTITNFANAIHQAIFNYPSCSSKIKYKGEEKGLLLLTKERL